MCGAIVLYINAITTLLWTLINRTVFQCCVPCYSGGFRTCGFLGNRLIIIADWVHGSDCVVVILQCAHFDDNNKRSQVLFSELILVLCAGLACWCCKADVSLCFFVFQALLDDLDSFLASCHFAVKPYPSYPYFVCNYDFPSLHFRNFPAFYSSVSVQRIAMGATVCSKYWETSNLSLSWLKAVLWWVHCRTRTHQ